MFKHQNLRDERLYSIWRKMHFRCESETHNHYKYYGGRGIKVCEEWNSFVNFCVWAMANGYADVLTLDRIDVNGNYEPSNCRWATRETQMNNTSKGEHFENGGKTKSFSVRKRSSWEYRIELPLTNGKRKSKTKSGFQTKEEAVEAAQIYLKDHPELVDKK